MSDQVSTTDKEPGYGRIIIALLAAGIATFGQLYAVQGVLTELTRAFHVSEADSALSVSAGTTGLACGVFVWTLVAERVGRLRAMQISVFGAIIIGAISCFAPTFWIMVALRFVSGALIGGVPVLAVAYVFETLDGARAAAAATAYISGTTLGGASGRLIAGPLAVPLGWAGALLVVAAMCFVAAIIFWLLAPSSSNKPAKVGGQWPRIKDCLRNPNLRRLYFQALILTGCFVAVYNFLGFRLEAAPHFLSPAITSLIFLTYLAGTVSSRVGGALLNRFGARTTMVTGLLLCIIGMLIMLSDNLFVLIVGLVVFTYGVFQAHASAVATTGNVSDTEHRGQASGTYNVSYYIGSGLGGWLLGFPFMAGGWVGMTITIIIALLVVIAVLMLTGRKVAAE